MVFTSIFSLALEPSRRAAAADATRTDTNVTARAMEWRARSRSEHQTVWQSVRYATNPATGRVRATTNSYVELSAGLNRLDPATGRWQPSSSAFELTASGAEANLAGHRVRISENINSAGSVLM